MRRVREELTAHVGGSPNVTQRMMIERCVMLAFQVALIDRRIIAGETLGLHDSNRAIAWNNSLRRTLVALGLEPASVERPQTFSEYWKSDDEAAA